MQDETSEEAWPHIMHALHGEAAQPEGAGGSGGALAARSGGAHQGLQQDRRRCGSCSAIGAVVLAVLLGLATVMTRVSEDAKFTRALNAARPQADRHDVRPDGHRHARRRHEGAARARVGGHRAEGVRSRDARRAAQGDRASSPSPRGSSSRSACKPPATSRSSRRARRSRSAVAEDSTVTVVVSEGSVKVGRPKKLTDVPAGGAVVAKDSVVRQATTAEKDEADALALGHARRERQAAQPGAQSMMKRWYGLTILVPQPKLMERKASFRASLDSTRQAIRGIEASTGLQFGYVGQNMAFTEPAAKPAAPAASRRRGGRSGSGSRAGRCHWPRDSSRPEAVTRYSSLTTHNCPRERHEPSQKRPRSVGVGAIVPRRRAAVVVAGRDGGVDDARVGLQELRTARVAVAVAARVPWRSGSSRGRASTSGAP